MASREWNLIDEEKFEFKEHYCAFLDILGYKEKAGLFFKNQYNLYGRIRRAMESAGVEENPLETPDDIVTRIFSDSIILSIKKNETSLSLLLNYIGQLTAWFSYENLYLRGGLSIGKYFEDFKPFSNYSFFSSEGLINSYQLEQSAKYPIILIDKNIITECPDDYWKGLIIKSNSDLMLNFVRYIINEQATNQNDVIAELDELIDIRNRLTDNKVVEKYNWLINYYLWYIKDCQEIYGKFNMNLFRKYDLEYNSDYQFDYYG